MQYLKQSTAATLKIGPFLDDTDGKTAETGLTIAQADVRLSKNGANIAQKTEATSCTHDELGIYGCPVDVTDTNTLGRLQLFVHESGALPVWHEFLVIPANVYDSMFSTDKLEVDLLQMGGVAQSATDLKDFADAGYDPSANKIEGCKVNDDMVGTDSAALAGTALSNATWTDARAGYLNNINNANLATIADISTLTATEIAYLNASISSRSSHAAADIWSVVTRALTDKAGFSLSAAGIDAIWDELTSGHTTAGSFGQRFQIVRTGTAQAGGASTITLDASASAANNFYNTEVVFIVGGTGAGQARKIDSYVGATKVATLASAWATNPDNTSVFVVFPESVETGTGATAQQVWEYATRALTDKAGFALSAAGITAIWEKNISAYSGAGYAGTYLKTLYADWLNAGRLDLILDAIAADVVNIDGDAMRGTNSGALASVCTEGRLSELDAANVPADIDGIKAKTDNLPSGIQKNIALSNFTFLMTDTSDDPKTGLTVTIQLSKDGGAFGNSSNSVTEITNGYYKINLTQTEMNADVIGFKATAAGANQTSLVVVTS